MVTFLEQVKCLIRSGDIVVSEHGYDELADGDINVREVLRGVHEAIVVEEYPDYRKGPCLLALQRDLNGLPVHVVWGVPKDCDKPAVLVTAYRPDPERWDRTFSRRL